MSTADQRPLPVAVWFALGVGSAVAGLLPWLVTGARLPLQNLAADQTTTDTGFSLLPFSQYSLATIVALLVAGGAVAGIVGRTLTSRRSRWSTMALVFGALIVQVGAAVQSTVVTVGSLEESSRSTLYAAAVISVIVVSILVSLLVLLLIALSPVPGATIALSSSAIVSTSWVGAALTDVMMFGPAPVVQSLFLILRWMPAVLVGCAIAWCGFRTGGRIAAVVVSLAALWIGPAFFTAVSAAAGTRVLAAYPAEMAQYGVQVFLTALTTPELVLPPLAVALVIGIAGSLVLTRLRPRSAGSTSDVVTGDDDRAGATPN